MKKTLVICLLALVLGLAACQRSTPVGTGLGSQTLAVTEPQPAQFVLVNIAALPGFYAVCSLDGSVYPFKIRSGEYVERQELQPGRHRVRCAVETLAVQVSFDCEHTFEVFSNEPVYLGINQRALPGTCAIRRLSLPPADFRTRYFHAREPLGY